MNARVRPVDSWNVRRIAIAGLLGAICAAYIRAFDFWQLDPANGLRVILDLWGGPLLFLSVAVTLFIWSIGVFIALWRHTFRKAASSLIAILVIPVWSMTLLSVPLFDPWFWYVVFNKSSFEAEAAAKGSSQDSANFTVIEGRDVSTGIAGADLNHFIALIYSESDPAKLAVPGSSLTHIYGKFYRRDEYF